MRRWGQHWLVLIVGTYVSLIIAWWAVRSLVFDGLWWVALLNTDALVLFLPLVLLLPLALWRRHLRLLLACLVPLGAFGGLYADIILPPITAVPASQPITVMSFNVLWTNNDYPRIAGAIRTAEADIVALQELRPGHLPALAAALGDRLPYQTVHPFDQFHTVGLLSRFPIESVTVLPNPPLTRALLVRMRVNDRPLVVIAAHLTPSLIFDQGLAQVPDRVAAHYGSRRAEVEALLATVRAVDQPTVILCDCNFTDTSEVYARMRSELTDSVAAAGWGLRRTMLAPVVAWPVQRLDYVWYTEALVAIDAVVGPAGGSDHLPIVTRLAWR